MICEAMGPSGQGVSSKCKAEWVAHQGQIITALCCSAFGPHLASGANDGMIHWWNMTAKPTQPLLRLRAHQGAVYTLVMVNTHTLVSGGEDGKMIFWDVRGGGQATRQISLDGSRVRRIALSPTADSLAVLSMKGVYLVDIHDWEFSVSVVQSPLPHPYLDLGWNERTMELYAAGVKGQVTVMGKVL